jgi:transcription initiation factor TFIIB
LPTVRISDEQLSGAQILTQRVRDYLFAVPVDSTLSMVSSASEVRNTCPSCSSPHLVEDAETGDIVCSDCGFVVSERRPVGEEPRYATEEGVSPERVGQPLSLLRPDLGLSTEIEERPGAGRLRAVQLRTIYRGRMRTLARALKLIISLSEKLSLSRTTSERAAYIYRLAVRKGMLSGVSARWLAAVAVYAACREVGTPRSLAVVAEAAGIPKKRLAFGYRKLVAKLELRVSLVPPERYVPKISDLLNLDERTNRLAYSILARAERNGLTAGKDPKGLATAALILACEPLPKGRMKKEFAEAAGVTPVTLRKRVRQLRKYTEAKS